MQDGGRRHFENSKKLLYIGDISKYFAPKCFALAGAAVNVELRGILLNKICKIEKFLCRLVNSVHDGDSLEIGQFCTRRIAEF